MDSDNKPNVTRREVLIWLGGLALLPASGLASTSQENSDRYGLIGKILCTDRAALSAILLEGIAGMPSCLSYIVANDKQDDTAMWESAEKHKVTLTLPSVQAAITKGRPLITGFAERFETQPLGGQGL